MGRFSGTLHKLADAGSSKRLNWNQLLNYLEGHSIGDARAPNPNFDSPLPPFTAPSEELERELLDGQGPKNEETPLRIAVRSAPSNIVAALCHLGPDATMIADSRGRLPLHWACRRPADDKDVEKILKILVATYPKGLVHRDDGGRTPLHYLFWYHASARSVKTVELFCQQLPVEAFIGLKQLPSQEDGRFPPPEIPTPNNDSVPANAAIVHDGKHGALPLHYAVVEGASKEVIRALLLAYPLSKGLGDRKGRTALSWYLGAGELGDRALHISGESRDPNEPPIYEKHASSNIVNLLVNSKVARTADDMGRYPLHWAAHLLAKHYYNATIVNSEEDHCLSVKTIQLLLDNHIAALTVQDLQGRTPLHILFDAVTAQQELEWLRLSRNKTVRDNVDLVHGGGRSFAPPIKFVEILLQSPDAHNMERIHAGDRPTCAAHVEDSKGRLPLHVALSVATVAEVVRVLIQSHPTSLVHTTEEQAQTPLHAALSSPYIAPMQTVDTINLLMQAYVTSRHGTFVNGRLALKMEDASGRYPLHYACENQASLEVTKMVFEKYPRATKFQNGIGDLPVHSLLDVNLFGSLGQQGLIQGATLATPMGWTSDSEESFRKQQLAVFQEKMAALIEPLCQDEFALKIGSAAHGMLPLHIAVAFDAISYATLYHILCTYPQAVKTLTTADGHAYSPLDLHEMRRPAVSDEEKWHVIRELIFSFGPTIDSHRRKEDFLDRCTRLIREELEGKGSAHATELLKIEEMPPLASLELTGTLSSIEPPEIDRAGRPQVNKVARTPQNKSRFQKVQLPTKPSPSLKSRAAANKKIPKSIYDEDDNRYVISPEATFEFDDDEDYFSDAASEDEEYYSDDYDSRYDNDSMFDDERTREKENATKKGPLDNELERETRPQDGSMPDEDAPSTKRPESITVSPSSEQDPSNGESESRRLQDDKKPFLSEVAMRLWVFFALFNVRKSPDDHYAKQVDSVLDELDFTIIEQLLGQPLPTYAAEYLHDDIDFTPDLTVTDVAHPHCKAAIYMTHCFVGRFDFRPTPGETILLHRSRDGDTVVVRATEHLVITEESSCTSEERPGDAEAAIWETGAVPTPPDVPKATFQVKTRNVCFKFMRNRESFQSEVECRKELGIPLEDGSSIPSGILPLINHFDADVQLDGRKADRRYKFDIHDNRFMKLNFQSDGNLNDKEDSISLLDYPFAIVTAYHDEGDLYDRFFHYGSFGMDKIREIAIQTGTALRKIHEKGFLHGNICMRSITCLPYSEENSSVRIWALSDLSFASRQTSTTQCMAGIGPNGTSRFTTSTFPPEMFVKLCPAELALYNNYWETVSSKYGVHADRAVVSPRFNMITGDCYVLRCYFMQDDNRQLPLLPYKLLPAREAADIWSFGQLLFSLCSDGHPLLGTNARTGHLLEYDQIATWDKQKAEAMIYGNVEDPLAQDILLHLLSPYEERAALSMETIMSHPFFTEKEKVHSLEKFVNRIVEQRMQDRASHVRSLHQKVKWQADGEWLKTRSKTLACWDIELQRRFQLAPSQLMLNMYEAGQHIATIPYGIVILPYKLVRNKSGKLTPSTKKDVERAERMGVQLLALSKACHYVSLIQKVLYGKDESCHRSASEISDAMAVSSADFKHLENEMSVIAANEVELFRENPLVIARRLVQQRIHDLQAFFEECETAFVYLVDEYEGVPIVGGGSGYPLEVTTKVSELVQRGLPFMHMCVLYMRGVAGSVAGLVKLIFEGAYPHIPDSWAAASTGLKHILDDTEMRTEAKILRDTITEMYSSNGTRGIDDLRYLEAFFEKVDSKRGFADLMRVVNGEAYLWTSDRGVQAIEEIAKIHTFADAFRERKAQEAKMQEQERKIAELEKALEQLAFRRKLNLEDPIANFS